MARRAVKKKRTPAQERATRRMIAANRKRNKSTRQPRRTARRPARSRNPIRYVIQAINAKTGAQGWFSGETIDDDIGQARTYKTAGAATRVAKQLFKVLPATWRLIVTHEHRP